MPKRITFNKRTLNKLKLNYKLGLHILIWILLTGCVSSNTHSIPISIDYQNAAKARTRLGVAYLEAGQLYKAKRNLTLAYQYAPNDMNTSLALAHYYYTVNDYPQTQHYYQTMLKKHPNDINLLNNYAALMCKIGDQKSADLYFQRLFQLTTGSEALAGFKNAALCAHKVNNAIQAKKLAAKILTLDPENNLAYQILIDIALSNKEDKRTYHLLQRYRLLHDGYLPVAYQQDYVRLSKLFD